MKIEELKKCDLFKHKRITDTMKKVVRETINTKKEHGFAVCLDRKDKLFPHEIIPGTRSRLKYQLRCPTETEKAGSFHTHTEYEEKGIEPERMLKTRPIPSQADLLIAVHRRSQEKIGCVGFVSSPKTFDVNCFDTDEIHKEMESPILGRETKEWMKRRNKYFSSYSFTEYLAEYMSLKLNRDVEYRSKFLCKRRFEIN